MRAAFALLMLLEGCDSRDLCQSFSEGCVGLRVSGVPQIGAVDQLLISVTGTVVFDGRTPTPPKRASLPLTTAVLFPEVSGPVRIDVTGTEGGAAVGVGHVEVDVSPGFHQIVGVYLDVSPGDGGSADLSPPDLAPATDGGASNDGGTPRTVFLLSARHGNLGDRAALARLCEQQAAAPPDSYQPVLGFFPTDGPAIGPAEYLKLSGSRRIQKPDGTLVATDETFFAAHGGRINQLANGQQIGTAGSPCVWTGFRPDGSPAASPYTCRNWTSNSYQSYGEDGDPNAEPASYPTRWAETSTAEVCNRYCHVYCLQYP